MADENIQSEAQPERPPEAGDWADLEKFAEHGKESLMNKSTVIVLEPETKLAAEESITDD
jgi:hypothetical protein